MSAKVLSKVLIHESDAQASVRIKAFCDRHGLVGITGSHRSVMDALEANIDLGGVFLAGTDAGLDLGRRIHELRPELPIFLRAPEAASAELTGWQQDVPVAVYRDAEFAGLEDAIERYIFNRHFPCELVRGICEISRTTLSSQFHDVQVRCEPPYLVNDRLVYGQLISLMPLETRWCRGYMMLQAEPGAIERAIRLRCTHLPPDQGGLRQANNILGEISNLIWGGIRARFGGADADPAACRSQVPILFDHRDGSISFGAGDPQLCFHYTLNHTEQGYGPIELYQKFIFNLSWTPELFVPARSVDDYVEAGELELF